MRLSQMTRPPLTRSPLARYGIAVVAAGLAVLLRVSLDPVWGVKLPFITFYPAVMASAWLGGFGPGMVTTLLCTAAAGYFWIGPLSSSTAGDVGELVGLLVFLGIGAVISGLNEAWRRMTVSVGESEERLKVTLASIGDAVIATDAEGRVTLLNGVAEALTRWSDADATGRPLEDVFVILSEESRRPAESPVRKALREGRITGLANHTVLRSKDGRETPIDDSAAPIQAPDGRLLGVVMVFRDITERRHIEREREALLERERAARAEVERMADSLRQVQMVMDTVVDLGLEDLARTLLARVRAALGSDTATILLLAPNGHDLVPLAAAGPHEDLDRTVRIPLGRGVAGRIAASERGLIIEDVSAVEVVNPWLRRNVKSLVGAPLRIGDRLIGVIHAGSPSPRRFRDADLTLLRLVADRVVLAVERARLHDAKRTALAEAETAREQAEAANRAKDQFLAVLSHELRTPLSTTLGWIRTLRTAQLDPDREAHALEAIERSTRLQARMVDDLLDVSRIAAGKMTLDQRPLNLGPVVAEAVEALQQEAKAKGLALGMRMDVAIGTVLADAARIRQIVWNLLVNAVRYTPSGGRVDVRLTAEGRSVRIVVEDTGVGIEAGLLPHVFERFRQADWRRAGTEGGLGLGLAIVREIVEMHGGTVEARSDGPGRGATFIVTLPMIHPGMRRDGGTGAP